MSQQTEVHQVYLYIELGRGLEKGINSDPDLNLPEKWLFAQYQTAPLALNDIFPLEKKNGSNLTN